MTIGDRLREERGRLGLSQADFAALAGASKGAQLKWEKGESSPTATILAAWAEAGADALYILTGRRTFDRPVDLASYVQGQLATIRRDIMEPTRDLLPGETGDQADQRVLDWHANALSSILNHDTQLLPRDLVEEIAHLLDIATNPAALALNRAHEWGRQRSRRRELMEQLTTWLQGSAYIPNANVANLIAALAAEHDVPMKRLVELVEDIRDDIASQAKVRAIP